MVVGVVLLFACIPRVVNAQNNDHILGARRFTEYCAGCHGIDGKGGDKAASVAVALSVMTNSDEDLIRIVRDGTVDGMPSFAQIGDANITAVVHYLRVLENSATSTNAAVTGDANAGRELYFGKAQCSTCHMIKGDGGFIGSDLSFYGRNHKMEAILQAITMPDNPLKPTSRVVNITTKNGQKITGVLRNEDSFNLVLQAEDGRYHSLTRSDLAEIHYTDHSLMPHDYSARLTSRELDDIVSFLIVASRSPQTGSGRSR